MAKDKKLSPSEVASVAARAKWPAPKSVDLSRLPAQIRQMVADDIRQLVDRISGLAEE